MKKILVIYPGFPHYRKGIIEELIATSSFEYYFIGDKNMMDTDIEAYNFKEGQHFQHIPSYKIKNFVFHKGLLKYLFNNKFDSYIFHASPNWITINIAVVYLKFLRKTIFNWTHGILSDKKSFKNKFYSFYFNIFDGVLLYSNKAKQNMMSMGLNSVKLKVINNSLDYKSQIYFRNNLTAQNFLQHRKEIFKNPALPQLLFIGRLTNQKRIDMILEALFLNKVKGYEMNLLIIGKGKELNFLNKIVKEKGLDDNVNFYGAVYSEDLLSKLIASSDLCVSPGEVGLTAIHSLMYGTPVITHNNSNCQMPEFESIIEGYNGTLFKHGDVESLSSTMINWISQNKGNRARIRENCYDIIDKKFNPMIQEKIISRFILEQNA